MKYSAKNSYWLAHIYHIEVYFIDVSEKTFRDRVLHIAGFSSELELRCMTYVTIYDISPLLHSGMLPVVMD